MTNVNQKGLAAARGEYNRILNETILYSADEMWGFLEQLFEAYEKAKAEDENQKAGDEYIRDALASSKNHPFVFQSYESLSPSAINLDKPRMGRPLGDWLGELPNPPSIEPLPKGKSAYEDYGQPELEPLPELPEKYSDYWASLDSDRFDSHARKINQLITCLEAVYKCLEILISHPNKNA